MALPKASPQIFRLSIDKAFLRNGNPLSFSVPDGWQQTFNLLDWGHLSIIGYGPNKGSWLHLVLMTRGEASAANFRLRCAGSKPVMMERKDHTPVSNGGAATSTYSVQFPPGREKLVQIQIQPAAKSK